MHEFDFLGELVLIGALAVAIILVFQKLKIPSVIGLIFTGILIGPSGIGAVYDQKLIATLAELAKAGEVKESVVQEAIDKYRIFDVRSADAGNTEGSG